MVDVTLGTQHRDIISVDDIIVAIEAIIGSDLKGYQEISVGTGIAPTISELVDYIWEETGRKSTVNKGAVPMRDNEPDSVGDNTVLESLTEWRPVYWKTGIREMINTMREELNENID